MPFIKIPNQSFSWLIAELAVVVIGILIAFQIEEWRTNVSDRESETIALIGLIRDLNQEVERIDRALESMTRQRAGISAFIAQLQETEPRSAQSIARSFLDMTVVSRTEPAGPTYQGLRENGRLYIVSNEELQIQLFRYFEYNISFNERLIEAISEIRDRLIEASTLDIHYATQNSISGQIATVVPVQMPVGGSNERQIAVIKPLTEIPRNPELLAIVGQLDFRLRGALEIFERTRQEAQALIILIEHYLG